MTIMCKKAVPLQQKMKQKVYILKLSFMKKVNISANFLLIENSKIFYDTESEKILLMSEHQILLYDNLDEYISELTNMYEHVKQKTKA